MPFGKIPAFSGQHPSHRAGTKNMGLWMKGGIERRRPGGKGKDCGREGQMDRGKGKDEHS